MAHTCHIAVVEVDPETGGVNFLGYYVVQDSGTIVNPKSLEGMVIGGTVQGIGSALTEECIYTEDGQLLSASFQDYLIPTAMEAPPKIEVGFVETPSPFTAYGIKGGGEVRPHGGAGGSSRRHRGCALSPCHPGARSSRHTNANPRAYRCGIGQFRAIH